MVVEVVVILEASKQSWIFFGLQMERDCLIGYGASNLIMERLMISSDAFTGLGDSFMEYIFKYYVVLMNT